MKANEALKISSIEELKMYNQGTIVELPPFSDDMPFVAKIRRPSMLVLAKQGKIPNELMGEANKLFLGESNGIKGDDKDRLKKIFGVFDVVCEACFVEPSWQDLKDAGIELTDDQYMFIFDYTQNGVKALKSFRRK